MTSKVLMFGWEYAPFYTGGLGIVTRSIIKSLTDQGVELTFVLPQMPHNLNENHVNIINASKINNQNFDITKIPQINIENFIAPYESINDFKNRMEKHITENFVDVDLNTETKEIYGNDLIYEVEKYANRASKIAEDVSHDIIHTHDWMTARAGMISKQISGSPHVMHIHATEFDRTGGNPNQVVYDIEREGLEDSDKIIAVSELTKNKLIKHYGIKSHKVHVVHNAIEKFKDADKIGKKINTTDKLVLFLGRLTLQKGADYLLEAASKVLKHKKRVKFVFVGKGDMLEYLIKKSISLGIEKNVMFAGFMDHQDVDKAYQMARVYVMPSVSEPFGITALEAIKNGTPVIVSKQTGVSEVIQNALKVDFWDVDELANQILAITKYNPLAKLISKNAEEELKKLNWDDQSQKIISVYNQISNNN